MTEAIERVGAVGARTPMVGPLSAPLATTIPVVDAAPDEHPVTEAPPAPLKVPVQDRAMRVEVSMTAGVQTVIIYDELSGQAVYQAPPEHTRQALDKTSARQSKLGHGIPSGPTASRR